VAVVTGAGSGIGRGIARALAAAGTDVVVADVDADAAATVASELRSGAGGAGDARSMDVVCDVSDRGSVEALAERAWSELGHVDILVNNAGVFPGVRRCIDIEENDARWVMDVNLFGTWYGCSVFGQRFVAQGTDAYIVNVASENSLGVPHTGAAFYTASKHAVLGLSDVLRGELPPFIGVSVVCPGMVSTNLTQSGRLRPERFGGPKQARGGVSMGMDPDEVGRRTVDGIRRGEFYIVTHPPVRELVEERAAELLAAFDAQAPRYDGDEELDTRAVMRRLSGSH
jgi:NAD(P)-dependent dehydrogenase (short-subunit alcohol dehydrogenase family)